MNATWQLTPTNGIKRKPNGKYAVMVRFDGIGSTYCLTENAESYEEALALRNLELRRTNRAFSAVGISRIPFGWKAFYRLRRKTWTLGFYKVEAEAAACRCSFDQWACYQSDDAVQHQLELHCTVRRSPPP